MLCIEWLFCCWCSLSLFWIQFYRLMYSGWLFWGVWFIVIICMTNTKTHALCLNYIWWNKVVLPRLLFHYPLPRHYPWSPRWVLIHHCFCLLNNALTWNRLQQFLNDKVFFSLSSHISLNAWSSYLRIARYITMPINAPRHQHLWLYFISAHAITSRIS